MQKSMKRLCGPGVLVILTLMQLGGCSALRSAAGDPDPEPAIVTTPWAQAPADGHAPVWRHYKLPGKQPSRFSYMRHDGRNTMAVSSESSASMLRQTLRMEPAELTGVRFSWQVPELMAQADMALRETDDSPVRIVLIFEGDRSNFSPKNAMLSELARTLTGKELPYATLMYVWCNTRPVGSVIVNPRTDRVRNLVVESGTGKLKQWVDYQRNIRADYQAAFGEEPGALVGIGIMSDSDNTRSTIRAWYGPVTLGTIAQSR